MQHELPAKNAISQVTLMVTEGNRKSICQSNRPQVCACIKTLGRPIHVNANERRPLPVGRT